jgi:hypothetical protein
MVAACEVRLLLSWLYVSPVKYRRLVSKRENGNTAERTVDGVPEEYRACFEASLNLVDPLIVECHPCGPVLTTLPTGLSILPEIISVKVPPCLDWVEMPSPFGGKAPETDSSCQNGACRRGAGVTIATKVEDYGAK